MNHDAFPRQFCFSGYRTEKQRLSPWCTYRIKKHSSQSFSYLIENTELAYPEDIYEQDWYQWRYVRTWMIWVALDPITDFSSPWTACWFVGLEIVLSTLEELVQKKKQMVDLPELEHEVSALVTDSTGMMGGDREEI